MDQVEVQVVHAEILHALLASWLDMLHSMECIPELGCDPKILSRDETFVDGSLDSFSDLNLVSIIASSIKGSVTSLDGLVHGFSAFLLGNFPETKAELGHLIASRQSKMSFLIFHNVDPLPLFLGLLPHLRLFRPLLLHDNFRHMSPLGNAHRRKASS
jgi:hypothetical protein